MVSADPQTATWPFRTRIGASSMIFDNGHSSLQRSVAQPHSLGASRPISLSTFQTKVRASSFAAWSKRILRPVPAGRREWWERDER